MHNLKLNSYTLWSLLWGAMYPQSSSSTTGRNRGTRHPTYLCNFLKHFMLKWCIKAPSFFVNVKLYVYLQYVMCEYVISRTANNNIIPVCNRYGQMDWSCFRNKKTTYFFHTIFIGLFYAKRKCLKSSSEVELLFVFFSQFLTIFLVVVGKVWIINITSC